MHTCKMYYKTFAVCPDRRIPPVGKRRYTQCSCTCGNATIQERSIQGSAAQHFPASPHWSQLAIRGPSSSQGQPWQALCVLSTLTPFIFQNTQERISSSFTSTPTHRYLRVTSPDSRLSAASCIFHPRSMHQQPGTTGTWQCSSCPVQLIASFLGRLRSPHQGGV